MRPRPEEPLLQRRGMLPFVALLLRSLPSPASALKLVAGSADVSADGHRSEVDRMLENLTARALHRFPDAPLALDQLSALYRGHVVDPFHIEGLEVGSSFDLAWKQVNQSTSSGDASLYGEILPSSVVGVLAEVDARPGMKYYDLGSGFGKTAVLAGLLGLQATGVELVDFRWSASCDALLHARDFGATLQPGQVEMVHGSILDFDFSDADVLFTDSLAFSDSMMERLSQAARGMKPHSRIITGIPFDERWFKEVGVYEAPSSWARDSVWIIQEPRSPAVPDGTPARRASGEAEMERCSS